LHSGEQRCCLILLSLDVPFPPYSFFPRHVVFCTDLFFWFTLSRSFLPMSFRFTIPSVEVVRRSSLRDYLFLPSRLIVCVPGSTRHPPVIVRRSYFGTRASVVLTRVPITSLLFDFSQRVFSLFVLRPGLPIVARSVRAEENFSASCANRQVEDPLPPSSFFLIEPRGTSDFPSPW